MNHGDAAPAVADGIVHVSFLSRGASIKKKKKNPSFLFVLVSAPFSVGFSFLSGSAPPPRSPSTPFSAFVSSSPVAFVSSTRPRLTSPSHRAKPSFLCGLRRVVDCRLRSPAARHPVRFSSSSQGTGGEGPSSKFLGLLWSSTAPATRHSGFFFSRSRRFRDPASSSGFPHYFSGSRPFSEFQGFPPVFGVAPTF